MLREQQAEYLALLNEMTDWDIACFADGCDDVPSTLWYTATKHLALCDDHCRFLNGLYDGDDEYWDMLIPYLRVHELKDNIQRYQEVTGTAI